MEKKDINNSVPNAEIDYETDVSVATSAYISDYYSDFNDDATIIVKVSTLKSYNYLENYECNGYAIASKTNGLLNIEPFVKCFNYVSPNYNSDYE